VCSAGSVHCSDIAITSSFWAALFESSRRYDDVAHIQARALDSRIEEIGMHCIFRPLAALFFALALAGCSTIQSLNPFHHDAPEQIASPSVPATAYGAQQPMGYSEHAAAMAGITELHYEVESEHIARDASCGTGTVALLLEKGPGYETYSVPCGATRVMLIRCEFSYCRTMQ